MSENIRSFQDLRVFQSGFDSAVDIFDLSRRFPPEERFSMTDQIRRSSRSVCTNIAEAWRKRRYEAAFVAKLSDSETEACETQVHLMFCIKHRYINQQTFDRLWDSYEKILAQLTKMIDRPGDWLIRGASLSPRRRVAASPRRLDALQRPTSDKMPET